MKRIFLIALVLFSLGAFVFSSCGGEQEYEEALQEATDDFESIVNETVADPDKAARIIELFNDNHRHYRELYAISKDSHEQFRRLNANYDATPDQFRQLFVERNDAWALQRSQLLENFLAMREYATPEEWEGLVKQYKRYLKLRIQVEYEK
jgi:hypothetical protein